MPLITFLNLHKPVEIGTRTKTSTPTSKNHNPDVIIFFSLPKCMDELILHRFIESVQNVRSIQVDKSDLLFHDQFNILVFHDPPFLKKLLDQIEASIWISRRDVCDNGDNPR